jgi:HAD superfamily hydrolase (TIGR01509 family)
MAMLGFQASRQEREIMDRRDRIEAVLWDSGDTLVGPVGGRWNPRLDFEEVLLRHAPDAPAHLFPEAFAAGDAALHAAAATLARDDYHRAILAELGVAATTQLLTDLDRPLERPVIELFPEAREVLEAVAARGLPQVIVSDNWLGAERLYEQLGAHHYFRGFVTSEAMGCRKPDTRMYRAGAALADRPLRTCLFVDDDPTLVEAAMVLGCAGAVIDRAAWPQAGVPPVISDLRQLLPMLDA